MLDLQNEKVRAYKQINQQKQISSSFSSSCTDTDSSEDSNESDVSSQEVWTLRALDGIEKCTETGRKQGKSLQEIHDERARFVPDLYEDSSASCSSSNTVAEKRSYECIDDSDIDDSMLPGGSNMCMLGMKYNGVDASNCVEGIDGGLVNCEDSPFLRQLLNTKHNGHHMKNANNAQSVSNTVPLLKGILEGSVSMRMGKRSNMEDKLKAEEGKCSAKVTIDLPQEEQFHRAKSLDSIGLSPLNQTIIDERDWTDAHSILSSVEEFSDPCYNKMY